jgi:hypothetical protein
MVSVMEREQLISGVIYYGRFNVKSAGSAV